MQQHTDPFTLTHTQAGCPLTCTSPSLLTSTYPPHNLSTIPSTILGRVNSQSHTESCAPPFWLPLGLSVDVTIHSCAEKSRLGYVQGGVTASVPQHCMCVWCSYNCKLHSEGPTGRPEAQPHLRQGKAKEGIFREKRRQG